MRWGRVPADARELGRSGAPAAERELGQMAVELAVLVPVIVVVALVILNVMRFSELCARFDCVAADAVVMHGVSPGGASGELAGVEEVKAAIADAMGDASCEVSVSAEDVSSEEGRALIDLAAGTTRYVCRLGYRPWPGSFSIAGVSATLPALAHHERSVVVDRYRSGVVS